MAKSKKGPSSPPVKSDAYVGLLIVALLAQIAAGAFLYLEYSNYPDKSPGKIQAMPNLEAPGGNPPGNPPVNPPVNPPMNPPMMPPMMPPMNPPMNPPGMM